MEKVKPNIGIVGMKGMPAKGGTERVVEEIVKRLKVKVDFTIYGYNDYIPQDYKLNNVKFVRLSFIKGKIAKPVSFCINSTFNVLKNGCHDIIHLHNTEAGFILPFLKLKYKYIISTAHGPGYDRSDKWNFWEKLLLRCIEIPFVKSSNIVTSVKKDLANYYSKKYNVNSYFIPNGVDADVTIDDNWIIKFLSNYSINKKDYLLFISGRFLPTKGVHTFLDAIPKINAKTKCLLIGQQGYIFEYDQLVNNMIQNTSNVYYHTLISDKNKVMALMKYCKFLIFPSSVEAMSMVLLEAASLGIPVICSDIPENIAVMGNKAIYFKVNNSDDLADKINYAMKNELTLKKKAAEMQKILHRNQSWDKIADEYYSLYMKILYNKSYST